ncbi:TetR family transcriptional regulator [Pseudonocardia bannensis]|uniref:TetR/AcrR family transcriptional regulator n=1 Tax=Pseudonocardia bannensis TaxID=630973 RepID=A0A848DIA5_9PSEU|nr:TetR family transcriptional regulator [Pseudonocardia bannensis]NMH92422.1 TetR/AcrR family transcriptional regulator [Pseudonocardia bannensis]
MSARQGFHARVRSLLRDQLLDAATEITCDRGWDAVTMSRVAARVGVSRQSVYNEVGSKDALAEAMVTRETDRFLAGVTERLALHSGDLPAGLSAAVEYTLREAADNPLIKAIVSAAHGAADDLLPLVAVRPEPVLERAVAAIAAQVRAVHPDLSITGPDGADAIESLVEVFVRLTLSHLVQPSAPIEYAVEQVRWIVNAVLAGRRG